MLSDVDGNLITNLPRKARQELDDVCARLTRQEIADMEATINGWSDSLGADRTDFFASNWKTGKDWSEVSGGIFQPLYRACGELLGSQGTDEQFQRAGWMSGWLVRSVMIRRPDDWVMYKNPEAGTDEVQRQFWGTFYWRRDRQ